MNAVAVIVGCLLYIPNIWTLLAFRFVQGFCTGAYSCLANLIVGECSPKELKGHLGVVPQLMVSVGVFTGALLK